MKYLPLINFFNKNSKRKIILLLYFGGRRVLMSKKETRGKSLLFFICWFSDVTGIEP